MPKKKRQETQAERSARFKKDARKLIAAGELNPTDAIEALDKLLRQSAKHAPQVGS
jgi:hypothetical protein